MPELQVDSTRIYYEAFGQGDPILFTCAGNATGQMWEAQVASLAQSGRTITWDWRGTGRSDKPASGYTFDTAVDDLCRLVEQVAGRPAILVGHGMGGHLTIGAALRRPDLLRGLCLADTAPWYGGDRDGIEGGMSTEFLDGFADTATASYIDALMDMIDQYLFHRPVSDAVRFACLQQGLSWPSYVSDEYDRSMADLDHRGRLGELDCPTVVIHGRHDRKQRYDGGVYLAEHIPGARLVTLEDSAHMGPLEETAAFNAVLAQLCGN